MRGDPKILAVSLAGFVAFFCGPWLPGEATIWPIVGTLLIVGACLWSLAKFGPVAGGGLQ